jgi:SHR-binding domain of vacuolar-sorting associated protein 13
MTDFSILEMKDSSDGFDSSIHFRVTLKKSTLLVGRPTSLSHLPSPRSQRLSFAVVQVVSNTLLMFQSIENPDATGTKTLHISIDNVSALVNTEFECVSPTHAPLILEPTGAEIRIVYATENFGCIVSQDISFNYDTIKSCLTTNDASIVVNVIRTMFERLRSFGTPIESIGTKNPGNGFSSFLRYQKRGAGVATRIRFEVHSFSLVLLRAYKSFFGAPEFLDFNVRHLKGLLDGCMSALSGELSCVLAIVSFNSNVLDWEYAVEPCSLNMGFEQMPNEFVSKSFAFFGDLTALLIHPFIEIGFFLLQVLNISPSPLQVNLTGILLRDFSEMIFDIGRNRPRRDALGITPLEPSVLSTIGLRRASEARSITIQNLTGLDLQIVPSSVAFSSETTIFETNTKKTLDTTAIGVVVTDDFKLSMRLAPSASIIVGERQPTYSIPVASLGINSRLFLLRPFTPLSVAQPGRAEVLRLLNGRSSPESMLSEGPAYDTMFYSAEPVVECCMQNQRLRPSVVDLYSLPKGHDLLSSLLWSPEESIDDDLLYDCVQTDSNGPEAAAGMCRDIPASFDRPAVTLPIRGLAKGNWLRPYLKNDSPEWSDMTCMLSIARERVLLPDSRWIWLNDWTVDVSGRLGEETDADGWSYEADFETFTYRKRHYARGDACRRRKWTRTRMVQPPRFEDPLRHLQLVWQTSKDENGCFSIAVRSHVALRNMTSTTLSFFVFSPSWNEDVLVGTTIAGAEVSVPVVYASAVYMRIAVAKNSVARDATSLSDFAHSDRFLMVPTSHTSSRFVRTRVNFENVSGTILHYVVEIRSEKGIVSVIVEPVFRVVNLLPCQLECQVGYLPNQGHEKADASPRRISSKQVTKTDAFTIQSGKDECCTAVNPWRKPHISLRVPGYKWSSWKKVVNRKTDNAWRPSELEEEHHFAAKGDSEYSEELMILVRFERLNKFGDPLTLVMSVACDHCPTIRVFSQYWIVDKTGFGCHFSEGFTDILGNFPDPITSRKSYFLKDEMKHPEISADLVTSGHEWSIGGSGMSLYFSQREKLTLSLETGIDDSSAVPGARSKWISPVDISNVIPKTVFSVDELNGPRRFELAIHVTLCPGLFRRTKMITLLPRYLIVNLLHRELVVAQDGCLDAETVIPSQSSISFHWEKGSLPPKIRLGAPSAEERARGQYERCWTNGRFQLDRVGITSLRLPTTNTLVKLPMVVQAEVRLATKDQSSAVVIVVWSGSEKSNPLYTLRNRTRHVILCRQPLQDDNADFTVPDAVVTHFEACTGRHARSSVFECGAELAPLIRSFLGLDRIEEFVWVLKPGDVTCFGFDDPEKPHIIEWTYVSDKKSQFTKKLKRAFLEVDAMGSYSVLALQGLAHVRCQIKAEHSTKVIEFTEIGTNGLPIEPLFGMQGKDALRQHTLQIHELLRSELSAREENQDATLDDDDTVAFSLKIEFPSLSISVVDNLDPTVYGREILLVQVENLYLAFSQTSEGYHNVEARLMTLQVDNHIHNSIHPVMVRKSLFESIKTFVATSSDILTPVSRSFVPELTIVSRSSIYPQFAVCSQTATHSFFDMQQSDFLK